MRFIDEPSVQLRLPVEIKRVYVNDPEPFKFPVSVSHLYPFVQLSVNVLAGSKCFILVICPICIR